MSETVSHRSDDAKLIDKLKSQIKFITFAKLIDKLKSQIKFITFVMQEYSKTYSTKDQAACNKALQTLDGRIHPGAAMKTAPFFCISGFPSNENLFHQSGNSVLSQVMFGSSRSKALCSMATLPISVSTDSSLGMAVRILVTLLKSRFRRSIQLVV